MTDKTIRAIYNLIYKEYECYYLQEIDFANCPCKVRDNTIIFLRGDIIPMPTPWEANRDPGMIKQSNL